MFYADAVAAVLTSKAIRANRDRRPPEEVLHNPRASENVFMRM